MLRALVFDLAAILKLDAAEFSASWLGPSPDIDSALGLLVCDVDEIRYFIVAGRTSEEKPIVVVSLSGENAVFDGGEMDAYVFGRLCVVVRAQYSQGVVIPYSWHQHLKASVGSIYAASKNIVGNARLHFDSFPAGCNDLYFFALTEEVVGFDKIDRGDHVYLAAKEKLVLADGHRSVATQESKKRGTTVALTRRITEGMSKGISLRDWYETKLTSEQREFVDKPYSGPVRLRGAAGTGKTISLIVKFLFDGCKFEQSSIPRRFCLLTHSSGTVDVVNGLSEFLDPIGLTIGQGKHVNLQIRTIYDLAFEYLRFDLDKLHPLSLDGREGRLMQAELISAVLDAMRKDKILRAQYSDISGSLIEGWNEPSEKRLRFISDLMNEFASILDADGVRSGSDKGERYARGTLGYRPVWLMHLQSERERQFVLEIHKRYRQLLVEMNTLSMDQMISDFNSFLDRNTWERLISSKGFDALFVDELHLFTSSEREVLHKLVRSRSDVNDREFRPPIFMAYDVKQSPRDTFFSVESIDGSLFSHSNRLQNSELVKLSKIFRYTKQIADFLYDLDAAFPTIDLAGEWEQLTATSEKSGDVPIHTSYSDEAKLFQSVFGNAIKQAAQLDRGQKVAVICVSEEQFDKYTGIVEPRFPGKILEISAREQEPDMKHSGKKVVFSMPEYVAGLQFDTVYLIHVDSSDFPRELAVGDKRRFISTVYLGATRAERQLHVVSCEARGGPASILDMAIRSGTLQSSS